MDKKKILIIVVSIIAVILVAVIAFIVNKDKKIMTYNVSFETDGGTIVNMQTINEGDKVYTSGLTSIPENIYVGEVIKTYYSNDNLGKIAIIKLLDYNSLNYVAILEVNDDI